MVWIRFGLTLVGAVTFASLGAYMIAHARREPSPRMKALGLAVAAVCAAFLLGALQRLALQALWAGWLDARQTDFLLTEWQLLQSIGALALGVSAWVMVRRVQPGLRRVERMVSVLTDRIQVGVPVSDLGLTARERQVLELITQGILSDKDIAGVLCIAPATVHSHVKNLLRKAKLSNRRELMLLGELPDASKHNGADRPAARGVSRPPPIHRG